MLDATTRLRRRLAGQLHPDETVLAGVSVHRTGTTRAALRGAGAATASGPGFGTPFTDPPESDDTGGAGTRLDAGPYLYLALTSQRVMVLRRSAFGRAKEVVFETPVADVRALRVKPNSSHVELGLADGRALVFETPKAPKFLPEVYRRLPTLLADAKAHDLGEAPGRDRSGPARRRPGR